MLFLPKIYISSSQLALREKSQGVREIRVFSAILNNILFLKNSLGGTQVFIFMLGCTFTLKGWEPLAYTLLHHR